MIIDYKIKSIEQEQNRTRLSVSYFEGEYQTLEYVDFLGELNTRNAYVRINKVKEDFFDVSGTLNNDEIVSFLNDKLRELRDSEYPSHEILLVQL